MRERELKKTRLDWIFEIFLVELKRKDENDGIGCCCAAPCKKDDVDDYHEEMTLTTAARIRRGAS